MSVCLSGNTTASLYVVVKSCQCGSSACLSNVSMDVVLQHIALGESTVPHGYSADESGNLLVDNKSESYEQVVLPVDDTELESTVNGSKEVEAGGRGKRRRVANTQFDGLKIGVTVTQNSNSSRDSTQETHTGTSSEATARESSHRPRGGLGRFVEKVKDGANKLKILRSKDSRSRSPIPPNAYHQRAPSTSNIIEVQAALSGVEVEADTQSAPRDAQKATKHMFSFLGFLRTMVPAGQDAQEALSTADKSQDTYLQPPQNI
ncbi:hypothetical protein DFJ58DRAFT_745500 [Suillus subalutaceus]|uniref:uncharacterized protein n=1 Tax=Suillus subalutaceus TaxID=48586 RepID=UPI001B875DC6|nr:uncharacterized protein DFJ58DRAFT_745500 [Suillus subalutaceus]KAG1855346.1 hypothetical protein DFJ58DRAFT_745500 [Suillus subalutaceus]